MNATQNFDTKPDSGPSPQAYTIRGFGDAYGVGKSKTWQLIANGELRAVKCGRRVLVRASDAERWAENLPAIPSSMKG